MNVEKLYLRYAITPAQLLYESAPARMQISKTRGEIKIEHEPLKLTIDNRAFLDSIGIKAHGTQARETAQQGRDAARDATGQFAREGAMMLGPRAMDPAQIAALRAKKTSRTQMKFIPDARPALHWSGGTAEIHIERDEMQIHWQPHRLDFRYIPYEIEFYLDRWQP